MITVQDISNYLEAFAPAVAAQLRAASPSSRARRASQIPEDVLRDLLREIGPDGTLVLEAHPKLLPLFRRSFGARGDRGAGNVRDPARWPTVRLE